MSIGEIIFNQQFIFAVFIHALLIIVGISILEYVKFKLDQPLLMSLWGKVAMPLYRAFLIGIFVFISYPIIFGLEESQSISTLISAREGRINNIINVLFLISLLFPLLPIIGKQIELILPLQVIACCSMVFSWLAETNGYTDYSYWPGLPTFAFIAFIAVITHYLANHLANYFGHILDKKFNVEGCQEIIMAAVILFLQTPAVLLYSSALGSQVI